MTRTLNTNVTLTKMEQTALAHTNATVEEIILHYRYNPIVPIKETANTYTYRVHNYYTREYTVNKEDCVEYNGQIYCKTAVYAR